MKHVFYVHSGITYLMSLGIILENHINSDDVVVLFGRSFQPRCPYKSYVLTVAECGIADIPSYGSRRILENHAVLKTLDRKVSALAGHRAFSVFIPTERNYLMQYLQTHRLCSQRSIIEEGLLTYHGSFVKPNVGTSFSLRLHAAIRSSFHLKRTLLGRSGLHYNADNTSVYVCTAIGKEMLQQYCVKQVNVTAVVHDFHYDEISSGLLFVFDPVVEKDICDRETYLVRLRQFISDNFSARTSVFIKFHPQQTARGVYLDVFKACRVPYIVIGDDVIPEVILATSQRLKVFGLCSSVLFYASEWNHMVSSFSSQLAKESLSYKNWVENSIPPNIIQLLGLI